MTHRIPTVAVSLLAATGLLAVLGAAPPPELGRAGMVASDHELASEAGAQVLRMGGNAVDIAVGSALTRQLDAFSEAWAAAHAEEEGDR